MDDRKLKLPNGQTIELNDEQYSGVIKIENWLNHLDNKFFVLSGYAGTGKTTIVKKILNKYYKPVAVSAPTHKAKKVIANSTDRDGITLHSILGLRPDINLEDFNPNDPKFNPIVKSTMGDYSLIIIDEASMINYDLYELIEAEAKRYKNIKILFMGDVAQIPPINERISYVFEDEFDAVKHHLTKIERQEDSNPLTHIYDSIRNNLTQQSPISDNLYKTNINSSGEGIIITNNNNDFRNKIIEHYKSKEYINDVEYVKLVAWTNKTVNVSNNIIRNIIYEKNQKGNQLVVGESLTGYKSIRGNRNNIIIDNSADYRVKNISELKKNEFDLNVYDVTIVEKITNKKNKIQKVSIIDHLDEDNLHDFAELHDQYKNEAKLNKKLWKRYYNFRRLNMLMVNIDKFRDGSNRSDYDVITKDLDYGYCLTTHKVQGSTYEHILILEDDINLNQKTKERNQIKYVALTRPRKTAVIFSKYCN